MKKYLWPLCYGAALTVFTAYIALDTFVLKDTYQTDTTQMNTSMFEHVAGTTITEEDTDTDTDTDNTAADATEDSGSQSHSGRHGREHGSSDDTQSSREDTTSQNASDVTSSDIDTYQNDNVKITLKEYYENNTKIYVADVQLTSAEYLKTAFANDTYGKNVTEKTSSIASAHNAILAINGDYYGVQETGYVIKNGIVYRDSSNGADILCVYADGTMKIINSDDKTAEELVSEGVWQAFCFGPGLIENGEITVSEGEEVGKAMASNPRTAIGMFDSCHYVFVVSDGRTDESEGLSLYELSQFMQKLGVVTAYNLDGGGSSTMYFNGAVVNNPTTNGNHIKERGVSDIVYIES